MTKRDIKFRLWDGRRLRSWEKISMFHMYCFDDDMTKKNDVWEQYTELKDVNGVEMYDGDLIRYNVNGEDHIGQGEVGQVVWHTNSACWRTSGYLRFAEINSIEVIGNIHENPELLEV